MFCENCGKEIQNGARFCPACGMEILPTDGEQETRQKKQQERQKINNGKKPRRMNREVTVLLAAVLFVLTGALVFVLILAGRSDSGKKTGVEKETNAGRITETKAHMDTEHVIETEVHTDTEYAIDTENDVKTEAETEQDSARYKAYYEKISELQQKYGTGEIGSLTRSQEGAKDGWQGKYLHGVCFAKMEDFNADGKEELITVYLDSNEGPYEADVAAIYTYTVEVWEYRDFACEKVYDGLLYLPHQAFMDEAVFLTRVEGIPYVVQGNDDVCYSFWGYGTYGFREVKTLENDWIEQTGCKIDGVEVSEREYQAEFEKWWGNCKAYQVVDFSNPSVHDSDFTLESEKMAAAGSLQETLAVMEETLDFLRKEAGVDEMERNISTEKEADYSKTMRQENGEQNEAEWIEINAGVPQITMSHISFLDETSELEEGDFSYAAVNLYDGDVATAWVEGVSGQGKGEAVRFNFDGTYGVDGIRIYAGYQKSKDIYEKNSRPSEMEIWFSDGTMLKCSLEDFYGQQVIEFPERKETSWISIIIKDVYAGSRYEDTAISEIEFY